MLASHKSEDHFGQFKVHLSRVDSTNNYAANLIKSDKAKSGTVILADEQTNGRGQRGSTWQSDAGMNLHFSAIWLPENFSVLNQRYINFAVSIAIINFLSKKGIEAQIKWPNDILVGKKKICGVLIENQVQGQRIKSSIIGVGLNVNQTDFENLSATSLFLETQSFNSVDDVLEGLIFTLNEQFESFKILNFNNLKEKYFSCLYGFQTEIKYEINSEIRSGKIVGVAENGNVEIASKGKVEAFGLKEIKFLY